MPRREVALRKYHREAARQFYDRPEAESLQRFRRIARLALKAGEIVLDVGCGTGRSFVMLAQQVGERGRVIGIEQSEDQAALARQVIAEHNWRNVTVVRSAVEEADIAIEADAAFFSFTHDIMRTPRALENVARSLKPGARIVAVGMKWAPWWALGANWRTWRIARNFITTFEGFGRPWSYLANLVS